MGPPKRERLENRWYELCISWSLHALRYTKNGYAFREDARALKLFKYIKSK